MTPENIRGLGDLLEQIFRDWDLGVCVWRKLPEFHTHPFYEQNTFPFMQDMFEILPLILNCCHLKANLSCFVYERHIFRWLSVSRVRK